MIKQLIKANPICSREVTSPDSLEIAEFFYDTIQGEGINTGCPATFIRVKGCSLDCTWCDTQEVWRYGNPWTFDELFEMMEQTGNSPKAYFGDTIVYDEVDMVDMLYPVDSVIDKLRKGQHLVLTGGSPLKQQLNLEKFIIAFEDKYKFRPYIEVENECTIMPRPTFSNLVSCWNNSPKLSSSGNNKTLRYKPEILKALSKLPNSWFKFVITDETDWKEIETDFLDREFIQREQIILMPLGETKAELDRNRIIAFELSIKYNVRFTDRLHITIFDKKTGV